MIKHEALVTTQSQVIAVFVCLVFCMCCVIVLITFSSLYRSLKYVKWVGIKNNSLRSYEKQKIVQIVASGMCACDVREMNHDARAASKTLKNANFTRKQRSDRGISMFTDRKSRGYRNQHAL